MDQVLSSEKDQLVSKENAAKSLAEVCLLTPVNSKCAEGSEFCDSDMESEIVMNHLPHSLAAHQLQSTLTEPSRDEAFADQCPNHDLTEPKDTIPSFDQEDRMYKQCLVSPGTNKHVGNLHISNKSNYLKGRSREDVAADLKTAHSVSTDNNVVNYSNRTTSKIRSRNNFRISCSNEKKRHLLNNDNEIETRIQKQTKRDDSSLIDVFYETDGSYRSSSVCNETDGSYRSSSVCNETDGSYRSSSVCNKTDENRNKNQHFYDNDIDCNDRDVFVSLTSVQKASVGGVRQQTLSNLDERSESIRILKVTSDRSYFEEHIENKEVEPTNSFTGVSDNTGSSLLPGACEGISGHVRQVVEEGTGLAVISGGVLYRREHQGSLKSLTKNGPVTQASSVTSEGMLFNAECQRSSASLTKNGPVTQTTTVTSEGMLFNTECQRSSESLTKNGPVTQASTVTSEGILYNTECQNSSASLTKNGFRPQTSFVELGLIPARFIALESSSSVSKGDKALLNCVKQNRAATDVHSDSCLHERPCKVVTKYVFINKSSKSSSNKRRFGVLYRHAFRHCHRAKFQKKKKKLKKNKKKSVVKEKTQKKPANRKTLPRKSCKSVLIKKEDDLRNQIREVRNKSREERRLARELKKCLGKDVNKKVTVKKRKKDEELERIEACSGKISVSERGQRKQNCQKSRNLEDNTCSIKDIGNPEATPNLAKSDNGITRKHLRRIQKKKLRDVAKEISAESKKKSKRRRICVDQGDIEVKEEIIGKGVQDNDNKHYVGVDGTCHQQKLKMRNRKDLTLQEKVEAIIALEQPGSKLVAVAKRFGVSVSAISRINKNRDLIILQSVSGDLNGAQRRSRECKDPELDKVLLRWLRAIERLYASDAPVAISNVLLKEKAHELAVTMGKNYFPSDNWIIRWKNRHSIGVGSSRTTPTITDREDLRQLDAQIDLSDVLHGIDQQGLKMGHVKYESILKREKKPEDLFICEHCGILTSTKKKKNSHLPGCPASAVRKDLTLEEKVQVVQALEQPGIKMVTLAKKYGVSPSAISRINKNRVDILARRASGLANSARRRDRGSKEPEVEKLLCEWFKVQHELGIHISGSMIREKARDIAKVLGKDFWPSESWVFRWRHRNNVTDVNTFLYGGSDDGELAGLARNNDNPEDVTLSNSNEEVLADKSAGGDEESAAGALQNTQLIVKKEITPVNGALPTRQFKLPLSVMCEKCGFVSDRVKNNRMKSLRHAKGCPDLKPRNELTYENRARMLKALEEPGATLSSVARQFGVSVSSMSRMNQKKDQILLHSEDHATQKRIRDCKEPEVAYTLYQWYMQKKVEGIHVPGPKLKEKAKRIAAEFGREFNASSGWLGRWRHRYNIINSVRNTDCVPKDSIKKKKLGRDDEGNIDSSSEDLAQLPGIPHEFQQNSVGSSGSVIESLEAGPAQQLLQTTPVFIHQRFQNPWEMAQQQADSCVWTKEFLTPAGSGILDDNPASVTYAYGDPVSKPVFHNMFDSFSAVGYQVALPLDSSVVVSREYLKADPGEEKCGPSGTLLHHASHSAHGQLSHHLASNLTTQHHLQHHIQIAHPQPLSHPQTSQVQQMNLSLAPASPVTLDDDPEQQRQVMEALKIMSSFAQKKSLGDQVQAALRTIEMSMKGAPRKASTRHTYTSI